MHKVIQAVIRNTSSERVFVENILRKIKEFNERDRATCLSVFDEIVNKNNEYEGFSIYFENKMTGFIFFTQNSLGLNVFELLWIVVDPDYQGLGFGDLLMNKFLEEVKKRNARLVVLHTSEHYLKAKSLYKKYGFNCEGIIKDFYSPGDSKEIWVFKIIINNF